MDPNPLLSTTAAAAAALVAIVGGLLVSRVISLATERTGLEQRLSDLHAQLNAAEVRRGQFDDRLLQGDVQEVLWEGREAFARGLDKLDIQAMIDEAGVDRHLEEVRPFVEEEAVRYRSIREHVLPLFAKRRPDTTFEELREAGIISVARDEETTYELVWEALVEEHSEPPTRDPFGIGLGHLPTGIADASWRTVSAIRNTAEETEHATLRRDAEEARHRVDALKIQIEQTELAVARVARPRGVIAGLLVLGYVTITGTLVPLALMAAGVKSMDWRGGAAVVGLFGSGIALLMTYVSVEVRHMTSGVSSASE